MLAEIAVTTLFIVSCYVFLMPVVIGERWLRWWHGEGEAHQYQFYRCHACRRLVTFHIIRSGGCPCHESSKISPTKLGVMTKARILYAPWTVTRPAARREALRRTRMAAERAVAS